jgi:hypothetical protein
MGTNVMNELCESKEKGLKRQVLQLYATCVIRENAAANSFAPISYGIFMVKTPS